jgi:aerobic C4-dicarboxylate transport protein
MPNVPQKPWYKVLYLQVLIAVAVGIAVGYLYPAFGKSLKPVGEGFVNLVKMMIAPIIFCTIVHGIASMGDLKKLGRIGGKTLLYFEVVSTFALVLGLMVVNVLQPGAGFHGDAAADLTRTKELISKAHELSTTQFFLGIIPTSFFSAFTSGDMLQVLLVAILTAFALSGMGERGKAVLGVIEQASQIFFRLLAIVVKAAPVGAFGAMGYTIGSFGIGSLGHLAKLMLGFYFTSAVFVIVVLGLIAWGSGFSIFRFLLFIKDELLLVLGTSSSETALPGMMQKMKRLGCSESTVGLVIPTGYSFNLDGTNIYMAMAAIFLAQATNTPLTLGQQLGLLAIAMITSKGASGVTGAGLITLAATLAAVPAIPIESLAIIVGIDRFMSECRAITNLIGNSVATVAVSRWEGEVTSAQLTANLNHTSDTQ